MKVIGTIKAFPGHEQASNRHHRSTRLFDTVFNGFAALYTPPAMVICPNPECSTELPPESRFCGGCSTPIPEETAENIETYEETLEAYWADSILEDWEAEELLNLRRELGIRTETHQRLEDQYKKSAAHPLTLDIDRNSIQHFELGSRWPIGNSNPSRER